MMEGAHLLLAVGLVAVVNSDDVSEYLWATVAVSIPFADQFTIIPLVNWGYLSEPI